jgi:hypothetical protein
MNGAHVPMESPCGANCSYTVNFLAPSFQCNDRTMNVSDLASLAFRKYSNETNSEGVHSEWSSDNVNYLAVDHRSNNTILGPSNDSYYSFDLLVKPPREIGILTPNPLGVSCVTYISNYTAKFQYTNFSQKVDVDVKKLRPLNASMTSPTGLLFSLEHLPNRDYYNQVLPKQFIAGVNLETLNTDDVFQSLNMLAIKDSLVQALGGAVSGYGSFPAHTAFVQANHLQDSKVK